MTSKLRKKYKLEQIVAKLRDADAMLNAGKDLAAVLKALEVSEAKLARWRAQYGGMKSEEAKRLKALEDENRRLKQLVVDPVLDIQTWWLSVIDEYMRERLVLKADRGITSGNVNVFPRISSPCVTCLSTSAAQTARCSFPLSCERGSFS